MNRLAVLLFIFGLLTCEFSRAQSSDRCAPRLIYREIYFGENSEEIAIAKNVGIRLSPEWDDSQILAAFGFLKAVPDGERVFGVDGNSQHFHFKKIKISISHSDSTGLAITIFGGRYEGGWLVEPCK